MTEKSYFNECCLVRSKSFKGIFSAWQHTTILMSSKNDGLCTIIVIIILFIRCWWKIVMTEKKTDEENTFTAIMCLRDLSR